LWALGFVVLLGASSAATAFWVSTKRAPAALALWDIPSIVANYTQIGSALAGLSLASAVFIATLAPNSPAFEDSIGLFVLSFIVLVGASMQFAGTPNPNEEEGGAQRIQRFGYMTANCSFYVGLAASFLGLRLLLLAIRLDSLADTLTWVLFVALAAGGLRLCVHLYRHTMLSRVACFAIPAMGFAWALAYWFGLASLWSELIPQHNQPLLVALVGLVVAGIGYGLQTAMLALQGEEHWEVGLARFGDQCLAGYVQGVVTVVALIWCAVAES
jgi:hypothetical protein